MMRSISNTQRLASSSGTDDDDDDSVKRICGGSALSKLEALPEELLIRVLCFVDHSDLISLIKVSSTIRKAALMAKRLHFAYSTPTKSVAFRNSVDLDESVFGDHECEAPCAPNNKMNQQRRMFKMAAAVSVVLFRDESEDRTTKKIMYCDAGSYKSTV